MSVVLVVSLVGIVAIGVVGVLGRRRPAADLEEWSVGGRNFGSLTTWVLQAGEIYTTFTFLGLAGLAFTAGVAVTYALPYLPLAYIGLYFIAPKVWRTGRDRGHITQGDFFADRFRSPLLGRLTAALGVVFLLPYLQLQLTGLGLVVDLVTGSRSAGIAAMIIAAVLVTLFVLWAGINGVARTAYLKDALMLVVLVVLFVVVPSHFSGGLGGIGERLLDGHASLLVVPAEGTHNTVWFFTAMVTSLISVLFLTMPQQWPAVLSAKNEKALRRNSIWMPVYGATQAIPIVLGLIAVTVLTSPTNANGVLLTLVSRTLPDWLVGVVAVAVAATAMVPAAGIVLGMSTLVTRNVLRVRDRRSGLLVNYVTVVAAVGVALVLGIGRPDALANLLLLTYGGLAQMAPATACALARRTRARTVSVTTGIVVGELVLIGLTFVLDYRGSVNSGLIALGCNIVAALATEAALRARRRRSTTPAGTDTAGPDEEPRAAYAP
ncbi:sodium:solute symporter family protein [Actinosynnema sp. CS-041913]|uniref:sodium:solute symporter family protein n=1 Tax=Actinosynnema sp. CS-041913 TaxID=3239917 RepID=UPI003D94239D